MFFLYYLIAFNFYFIKGESSIVEFRPIVDEGGFWYWRILVNVREHFVLLKFIFRGQLVFTPCRSQISLRNMFYSILYCLLLFRNINVSIPRATRNNGTMFVHIFLYLQGSRPLQNELASYSVAPLTKFIVERSKAFNLMSENGVSNEVKIII